MAEVENGVQSAHKVPITFDLKPAEQPGELSLLEEEREKHRRRATKFGMPFIDPATRRTADRALVLEARKERLGRDGFSTGIDLFSKEEIEKRASRAARFGKTEAAKALEYAPDEEEVAKVRRAKKFGNTDYNPADGALMEMDLFEKRAEVSKDTERRYNAIYLYGVDVMSTGDCLSYFGEYGPTFVEWINDSSCVVVFRDKYSAQRAMVAMGRPLPADEMTGESSAGMDVMDAANMQYFWHKGQDFVKQGTAVHLIYRMACVTDKKDTNAERRTRELWKTGAQRGGGYKSRRTHNSQSAGHDRVDEDGDVEMMDADYDEEMTGARRARGQRGGRKRKGRKQDGSTATFMDVEDEYAAMAGGRVEGAPLDYGDEDGAGGQGATAQGTMTLDYGGDEEERPGGVQGEGQAAAELDPLEGRMGSHGNQGSKPQSSFLRRVVQAKRNMSRQQQQQHQQGEAQQAATAGGGSEGVVGVPPQEGDGDAHL